MRVEYWSAGFQQWRLSEMELTAEDVAEMNRLLGWEMYREAE